MENVVKNGIDANYRCTVRVFPQVVEVTTKPINHQLEIKRSESFGLRRPSKVENLALAFDVPTKHDLELRQLKDEENRERALRRAKQAVRWQVQRFQADYMLTLTYRENMLDEVRLKCDFDQFRRYVQARYPNWSYVAAKEKQKRGAFHLHLAVVGFQDISFLRTCWYRVLGCPNATKDNTLGQVNITRPFKPSGGRMRWNGRKLAGYLSKYIAKEFDETPLEKKRYWVTKGAPKFIETKYWLASSDMVQMIKDSLQVAHRHGMTLMPDFWQSPDRTILTYHGEKIPIPF